MSAQATDTNPDRLYEDRANLASAKRAAELLSTAAEDRQSYEAAWKLARVCYWLGSHAPPTERRKYLEQGVEAGQLAAKLKPDQPEGHFWTAATMGSLAESSGLSAGLKYRKQIKEELETVLRIDPGFQQGSADRALGRWYFKVPAFFGGSNARAEEHLRSSLKYNPHSTVSHYFLAEVMIDQHRTADARMELQAVLDAPFDAAWAPEDNEYKAKARDLLSKLR
jgi:hypothetical protein